MTDLIWPEVLRPTSQTFYLQPHVGGAESPLTRTRKLYGLSAPRWIARMSFVVRSWGHGPEASRAARIEALIAEMEGGLNPIRLWDFRRETTVRPQMVSNTLMVAAAISGAEVLTIAGFAPRSVAFSPGDYVGGDGRPHLVRAQVIAGADGVAQVPIRPPLSAGVPAGPAVVSRVSGLFRLNGEDAGANETIARQRNTLTLDFVEDLR